jgi:leucyl aminopeptidase
MGVKVIGSNKAHSNSNSNSKHIIVSSSKTDDANIIINNSLDILLKSIDIKSIVNNGDGNGSDIVFNLSKLNKRFVKGFVYRIMQGLYVFNKYKSVQKKTNIYFDIPQFKETYLEHLMNIVDYSKFTRNIINEPSNIYTPAKLGAYACSLFNNTKYVKVNKYNHNDIKNMGLRLIDAVGGSSDNKPCFIVLEYKPPKCKKTICLV